MNSTAPRLDTAHPPCPPQSTAPQTIEIPDASRLAITDRLSLRIGLWLLLRAQRPRRQERPLHRQDEPAFLPGGRHLTQHEALTVLTYQMQRQLR